MSRLRLLAAAGAGATALHGVTLLAGIPLLRPLWPRLVGQGRPDSVALTFDDGPDDRGTPQVLEVLADQGVTATFFVLGSMCERYPAVLQDVVAAGHEIAVHSWDHRNHLRHPLPLVHQQISRTTRLVEERTGTRPRYFRPPYGALTSGGLASAKALGLETVLWTAWGRDWEERATGESIARLVRRQLRGGGTVLLHDSDCTSSPNSWRDTVAALPDVIAAARESGWTVGPVGAHGLA